MRTPAGSPHSSSSCGQREHRERRLLGRLDDHRAAGGDRRADLAGAHRDGEVPRGDEVAGADRLAHDQHPPGAVAGELVVAVDAQRLAREPAEELGRVGDLRLRLGDGLAHLQRHQQRELVGALVEQLEGAPEDLPALVRRRGGPVGLAVGGGVERGLGVLGGRVGDLAERLAGRRVLDRERRAAARVAPLAADQKLLGASSRTVFSRSLHAHPTSIWIRLQRIDRPADDRDLGGRGLLRSKMARMRAIRIRLAHARRARHGAARGPPRRGRHLDDQGPRLRPRRRPVAVGRLRLRQARTRLPRILAPLLHGTRRSAAASGRVRVLLGSGEGAVGFSGARPRLRQAARGPAATTASPSSGGGVVLRDARRQAARAVRARRARRRAG